MAINWKAYLPLNELPRTGKKNFVVGEVYASRIGDRASVGRVLTPPDEDGYSSMEHLAGVKCSLAANDSDWANHAVLIQPAFAEKPFPIEGDVARQLHGEVLDPAPLKKAPQEKAPRYAEVVQRVLLKAAKHKREGRVGCFKQCFVPLDDYDAMVEHFGENGASVWTCLGMINVYPINPDGATFSE